MNPMKMIASTALFAGCCLLAAALWGTWLRGDRCAQPHRLDSAAGHTEQFWCEGDVQSFGTPREVGMANNVYFLWFAGAACMVLVGWAERPRGKR